MVTGEDGSADFVLYDCLYYKGKNMSKQMFEARQEVLLECHAAYHATAVDCGFSLSFAPYWEATEERFWQLADEADSWRTILFVPAGRGLKLGSVQSTLFELSSVDFTAASEALTEAVVSAPTNAQHFAHFAPVPQPPPLPKETDDVSVTITEPIADIKPHFAAASEALTEAVISAPSNGASFAHGHFAPVPQPPPLPPKTQDTNNGVGEVPQRVSEAPAESATANPVDQSKGADSSEHDGVL
jgi:hypothetical protein